MRIIVIITQVWMDQPPRERAMGKHEGKVAVVTGGTSGIGLATAQRLQSEGAYVFITGRRKAELGAALEKIGGNVAGVQGDVSKLEDLDRLYAIVKKEKGGIDILFAHAGVGEEDVDPALLLLDDRVEPVEVLELGDVALHARDVTADLLQRCAQLCLATTGDEDVRALTLQALRGREPDARGAARDHCHFAFVLAHGPSLPWRLVHPYPGYDDDDPH